MRLEEIEHLYHGTNNLFAEFDFSKAKPFKDFGKGFYLTTNLAQAQKWAQRKAENQNKAYLYQYQIDKVEKNKWKILELLSYNKEWVDFISRCRIYGEETEYDIIYDRMADNHVNDISETLQRYVENKVSADMVVEKIKWSDKKGVDQFCFKTKKAMQLLVNRKVFVFEKDDEQNRWKPAEVI